MANKGFLIIPLFGLKFSNNSHRNGTDFDVIWSILNRKAIWSPHCIITLASRNSCWKNLLKIAVFQAKSRLIRLCVYFTSTRRNWISGRVSKFREHFTIPDVGYCLNSHRSSIQGFRKKKSEVEKNLESFEPSLRVMSAISHFSRGCKLVHSGTISGLEFEIEGFVEFARFFA